MGDTGGLCSCVERTQNLLGQAGAVPRMQRGWSSRGGTIYSSRCFLTLYPCSQFPASTGAARVLDIVQDEQDRGGGAAGGACALAAPQPRTLLLHEPELL